MHPAPSVIIFTVLSGAGFGYLAALGLGLSLDTGWPAFWQFALGFALSVGGLMSSTLHLGNPQRALLAFTQWRTSWLSREAVLSVATLVVMGIYAVGAIFFGQIWWPLGIIGAALAIATVGATSMIYAQMATVPRWNTWLTPAFYVAMALTAGAILSGRGVVAIILLIVLTALQIVSWQKGDRRFEERGHSMASATGLGTAGNVRQFEPPHTGSNYLLKEFGFQVARRHARKLWMIGIALQCALPLGVMFIAVFLLNLTWIGIALTFVLHLAGAFVTRWLFFAEAEHVVGLYYGLHSRAAPPSRLSA